MGAGCVLPRAPHLLPLKLRLLILTWNSDTCLWDGQGPHNSTLIVFQMSSTLRALAVGASKAETACSSPAWGFLQLKPSSGERETQASRTQLPVHPHDPVFSLTGPQAQDRGPHWPLPLTEHRPRPRPAAHFAFFLT